MKKLLKALSIISICFTNISFVESCDTFGSNPNNAWNNNNNNDNDNNDNNDNDNNNNDNEPIELSDSSIITELGMIDAESGTISESDILDVFISKNAQKLQGLESEIYVGQQNETSATIIANEGSTKVSGQVTVTFEIKNSSKKLSDLITETNLGDVVDSNDQTIINKIKELNTDAPDDLYFIDNTMEQNSTSENGSAILKSHKYSDEVNISYTNTINDNSSKANDKSIIYSWEDANLSRESKTAVKTNYKNSSTYYSPYLDSGMWQGNEVDKFIDNGVDLSYSTIAFVTQDTDDDGVNIGENKIGSNMESGYESMLKNNILDPIYKANNNSLKNLKISFGGASSSYEIWQSAEKKFSNSDDIVSDIKNKIISTSKIFSTIEGSNEEEYTKNIDFDIESENDLSDKNGIKYLFDALAELEKEDSSWNFSLTVAATPSSGMSESTSFMLSDIASSFSEQGISKENLVTINPMCMDYGTYESGNKKISEFELARKTVNAIKEQYQSVLKENNYSIDDYQMYSLMAATPMIGINDTISEVFTVEDAKELYNWANNVGLSFIGNWSGNDDHPGTKTSQNNGLAYVSDYDFAKAFNGNW